MTSKAKKLSGFPNEIPYDNTVSGLTATDVQAAIDEVTGDLANIDLAATNVTYNNSTSGLTATDVQAAIDEVTGDLANIDLAATNVTYNNSTSGLTATDVQAAIDEVTGDLANIDLAATNVTYNNSTSDLIATDVQAAIDELANAEADGGATGSDGDQVFVQNDQFVTSSYSIPAGKNAMSTGPIQINAGVIVTVPDGSRWVVI